MSFEFHMDIYAEDVDFGGIVYHANYFRYAERARTQWLQQLGFPLKQCVDENIFFVVRHAEIDYLSPARLSDHLVVGCEIQKVGRSSIKIYQPIWREDADQQRSLLTEIQILLVHVNQRFKPCSIPKKIIKEINHDT